MALLCSHGKLVRKTFDVPHLSTGFKFIKKRLIEQDWETPIVMEGTGHYYELVTQELILTGLLYAM